MAEKLHVIKTCAEMDKLIAYLEDKSFIAYDTETVGLDIDSEIIGFSVCAEVDEAFYVILSYWDPVNKKLVKRETHPHAINLIRKLVGKNLIMQNATADCRWSMSQWGVDLMPSVHTDTLLLGHLLNENRSNGLKERGVELYGEDARAEQAAMKESVHKNGGTLTKACYELYKADEDLLAYYGAKDALLTLKVFYNDVPQLFEQGLDAFFYDEETMPLLRGPTYDLNTAGLRIDPVKLQALKSQLETEILELQAYIYQEIDGYVKDKYPGTSKAKTFNIGSSKQLAWLLFDKLGNDFALLTKGGKALCKALDMKLPYSFAAKREFAQMCKDRLGQVYAPASINPKTGKMGRPKKIGNPWDYMACGKVTLGPLAKKYKWVEKFLEMATRKKLLSTYVLGIEREAKYNIVRPDFMQSGTTSGRYSCKKPNFQNLPRDDKRVKACIIAEPGMIFVGADYSQLEPRVFASISGDAPLLKGFADKDDFYSVVGQPVYGVYDCTLKKDDSPNSFPVKYKKLRDEAKIIALSIPYGKTAYDLARTMGKTEEEAQDIIESYLHNYPGVAQMMLDSHEQAKTNGVVYNLFGRPRRMPAAMDIPLIYGKNTPHAKLPYEARNLLNLAMNHRVQSTGASIMNRAAIAFTQMRAELALQDATWLQVKIVMQIHDEIILKGPIHLEEDMKLVLKSAMEDTTELPGVALIAEPKSAYDIAGLK